MPELTWEGKYDAKGRKVAPLRVSLPFQTVETVNESVQERQKSLDLFGSGHDAEWRNRLIWGDKKYVLPALMDQFAGKVDLIYIDPPFATGQDFSFSVRLDGEEFVKEPSMIEVKAYRDTWGSGLDSYLRWFYETAVLLRDLLTNTGSLYVHLDWHVVHYVRVLLDEVFGRDRLLNQVTWKRIYSHSDAQRYGVIDDTLLFYSKTDQYVFNKQFRPHSGSYIRSHYGQTDIDGRQYRLVTLSAAGSGPPRRFGDRVIAPPPGRHWAWSQERIDEGLASGKIVFASTGQPNIKQYLDETQGTVIPTIWDDLQRVNPVSAELLPYPTQKPEALLERIIKASSREGDLVLDCFVGSGTTAAVAEKLGRRWIVSDLSRFAIHTSRKRLLSLADVRPFLVQNLGKYERQLWQTAEFGDDAHTRTSAYRRFIVDLFGAKPIEGYVWLHGIKSGSMVHVGTVDAPVTVGDVKQIAAEFRKAIGTGEDAPKSTAVDVLGWDFAFELNEVAKQEALLANILIRFVRIPREVLDKRAVEQGDVRFFELAALSVDVTTKGRIVSIRLADFMIPLDDVPDEIQRSVKKWTQWVDYWAVDWNNHGDTFHNEWQAYRTRAEKKLETETAHEYEIPGRYRVVVKVVDILGNDTTKTLDIEVT